ncbi:cytolytic toxin-alpha-like [Bolinopsis microptera]|uniref:cytolytic toxin-alpha-like n=1 Tax=Bolinopsis microptera TaxID=2820187 RepID=UPI00307AECE8
MADIRLLLGILFMFGGVAAVKCPKGIRAFATFADDEYYECAEGKEAVLKKCNAGMKFNKKLAECANPDDLEKRGLKESSESGSHERVSMGEAIKIGALYDVRRGFLYNGFNLWSKKTLKEEIYSVESDGLNVEFLVEKNARDKAKHFGLGAQLELDFLAGLISIKGSAQFLKDYRKTTNSVRMILKGELIGSTEDIDTYTPIDYPDLCEMVTPTSGPTHVITRITKGQRSYFIFDKYVEHNRNSEDIEAELAASVSFIPLCSIEGRIAIHANGTQVKNIDRLNVRFYGDALLASFPTQYPQAAVAYDDTIRNGPRTTPMRYHVTPISEFCDSLADADNVIIHKITEDLVELSSNSLSVLRGIQASVNTLLELDPAIRYESIKLPLITFKNALEEFMSEYRRQLVDILPKVKAKLINESALVEILTKP